eukprot:jgi/Psemu1/30386/gm1.30386_g
MIVAILISILGIKNKTESLTSEQATNAQAATSVLNAKEEGTAKHTQHRTVNRQSVASSQTSSLPEMKRDLFVEEEKADKQSTSEQSYSIPALSEGQNRLSQPSPLAQQLSLAQPVEQFYKPISHLEHGSVRSKASKRRLPSPMAATLTRPVQIDPSSLSEKMRKRRLNGEVRNGINAMPQQQDCGVTSRKKRKLNSGRVPLQGYVARRPTVGAWKTTKALDKREREEREERLLRGMNRKRSKPTTEKLPSVAAESLNTTNSTVSSLTSTSATPSISAPAFGFGQSDAKNSAVVNTSSDKQVVPVPVSTPAPTFQFGANKQTVSDPSKQLQDNTAAVAQPEAASQAPPAFPFGNASTETSNSSTNSSKPEPTQGLSAVPAPTAPALTFGGAPASSAPAPAPTFKAAPAPSAPAPALTFGAAPVPSAQAPAPTFGAAPASSAQAPAPTFGAAPASSAQAPAPTFGAVTASAPTFGTEPASSAQAPALAPTFGATPAPAPTFGAAPAPAAFGATTSTVTNTFGTSSGFAAGSTRQQSNGQFSFGNTKENQVPAPSNGFMKPQPSNGNSLPPLGMKGGFSIGGSNGTAMPSFGGGNGVGFNSGNTTVAAAGTASARRMARKSRNRRR